MHLSRIGGNSGVAVFRPDVSVVSILTLLLGVLLPIDGEVRDCLLALSSVVAVVDDNADGR